jgi:threonine dehydratase
MSPEATTAAAEARPRPPVRPALGELEAVAAEVSRVVPPTPQISWPLLNARTGCELWVKHENHTEIGSFKIRGAVNYLARAGIRAGSGVATSTRGNHGQAVAFAASRLGLKAVIVVPRGNSLEKNRAMAGLGAELIEHGDDYQAAFVHSRRVASERGYHWMPGYHPDIMRGNAASSLDFLRKAPALDRLYVPVGTGSGICAAISARDALGLRTEVIGVGSALAPAYGLSFRARQAVVHPSSTRIADGIATSTPDPEALAIMLAGASRFVLVTDEEAAAGMRAYFTDTHNVAEGAAGAALAAVLAEAVQNRGLRVGVVLSGGNVDAALFSRAILGEAIS